MKDTNRIEDDNQVEEQRKDTNRIDAGTNQVEESTKDTCEIDLGSTNEPETIEHANHKKETEGNGLGYLISSSQITRLC